MQLDTPMRLYNNPANKFVAGFIGSPSMNFLKGVIRDEDDITPGKDGYYFAHDSGSCLIALGPAVPEPIKNKIGQPVILGIRPENILIDTPGPDTRLPDTPFPDTRFHDTRLPDTPLPDCRLNVIAVENMGNEQLIYLSLADQTLIARRPPLASLAAGAVLGVRFMPDHIYYFDAVNERIIRPSNS
jgi:multiple sugar transport system ATP-binding protein